MVVCGFTEISKTVIVDAKVTIRFSFSCFVSDFFGDRKILFMILYGFLEFCKAVKDISKITIRLSFSFPVSNVFCRLKALLVSFYYIRVFVKKRIDVALRICNAFFFLVSCLFRNCESTLMIVLVANVISPRHLKKNNELSRKVLGLNPV